MYFQLKYVIENQIESHFCEDEPSSFTFSGFRQTTNNLIRNQQQVNLQNLHEHQHKGQNYSNKNIP